MNNNEKVVDHGERLQKVLAHAGIASRRASEELIRQGRVSVNGQIAQIGQSVTTGDEIMLDGTPVKWQEPLVYYLLNKPVGVVSTVKDEQRRRTVLDLVPVPQRVYPVGRLDTDSEGLVLLTNDGPLAFRLTHPRYGVLKTYNLWLTSQVSEEDIAQLVEGIVLEEGLGKAVSVKVLANEEYSARLQVVMREGHKREIRRMCLAIGKPVKRLQRVAIGNLQLYNLPSGQYRTLTPAEVKDLYHLANLRMAGEHGQTKVDRH